MGDIDNLLEDVTLLTGKSSGIPVTTHIVTQVPDVLANEVARFFCQRARGTAYWSQKLSSMRFSVESLSETIEKHLPEYVTTPLRKDCAGFIKHEVPRIPQKQDVLWFPQVSGPASSYVEHMKNDITLIAAPRVLGAYLNDALHSIYDTNQTSIKQGIFVHYDSVYKLSTTIKRCLFVPENKYVPFEVPHDNPFIETRHNPLIAAPETAFLCHTKEMIEPETLFAYIKV